MNSKSVMKLVILTIFATFAYRAGAQQVPGGEHCFSKPHNCKKFSAKPECIQYQKLCMDKTIPKKNTKQVEPTPVEEPNPSVGK